MLLTQKMSFLIYINKNSNYNMTRRGYKPNNQNV